MKQRFITLLAILAVSFQCALAQRLNVIFETDMGNDVDDALAIDMLYKYHRSKKIDLMAVMLNKEGQYPPRFIDLLNRWYGCKRIPIGVTTREKNSTMSHVQNFTEVVCKMKDEKGRPLYKQLPDGAENWQDAVMLHRKLLAKAEDSSVTIISVGFSNNLSALLESQPDGFSPLSGKDLVAKKVDRLVVMAGHMENPNYTEFNVKHDIPACQKVYNEWPTPIYTSPFELGEHILYPARSIRENFGWTKHHPIVDAYKCYLPNMEDRPTWDLTAVLFAIDPGQMFSLSPAGRIHVTDRGCTTFKADATGNHYYLYTSPEQKKQILDYFVNMITKKP